MKKMISVMLAVIISMCVIPVYATDCEHVYTTEYFDATCVSREKQVNTCTLCGYWYEDSPWLFNPPDSFYVAVTGERQGDKLYVTVSMNNNPGLWSTAFKLYYNTEALTCTNVTAGDVWIKLSASANISPNGYVSFLGSDTGLENNYRNGTLLYATFDIKGEPDEWGFNLKNNKMDFINNNSEAQTFKKFVCVSDGYADHSFDELIDERSPTVYEAGAKVYGCSFCDAQHTEEIPMLEKYAKYDVDNDLSINAKDVFYLIYYIKYGVEYGTPEFDAADADGDGALTALDVFSFRRFICYGE